MVAFHPFTCKNLSSTGTTHTDTTVIYKFTVHIAAISSIQLYIPGLKTVPPLFI